MLDNALFALIKGILVPGIATLGYPVSFAQSYQPTQQGLNTVATYYCQKLPGDKLVGSPRQDVVWSDSHIAEFTGSLAGGVLTVTAVTDGVIGIGQTLTGAGIPENTFIQSIGPNTSGGIGTYGINQPNTVASTDIVTIGGEVTTQTQQYESTFQLNCLATQNPNTPNAPTASDLLNFAAAILQSQPTIATLRASNVGILKIAAARNTFFRNDRDRFQASPSFDFALTHKQIIVSSVPVITGTELRILRV